MLEVVWNWWAFPGLLAATMAFGMAAFVYFSMPTRAQNRRLALVLFFEGSFAVTGYALERMTQRPQDTLGMEAICVTSLIALPFAYLFFLATLDTPWTRPLRTRIGQGLLALVLIVVLGLRFYFPREFFQVPIRPWYASWESPAGPGHHIFEYVVLLVFLFGILVAWSARRAAKTTLARRRATAYMLAFVTRDVLFGTAYVVYFQVPPPPDGSILAAIRLLLLPVALMLYLPMLLYGILKTQLFDIDLKIKFAFRQSTVMAAFVGVFFVASQIVAGLLSNRVGLISGIVAAGLLLFAIVPLRRFSGRVADLAMPGVEPSTEYLLRRKYQVYAAALEEAETSPAASPAERAFVKDLRLRLGISRDEHRVLALLMESGPRLGGGASSRLEDRFRIEKELGRGSSGVAHLAQDLQLSRRVVLKQPLGVWLTGAEGRKLFLREAKIAAQVHHPNVVTVHEVLADADPPVLVLEYAEGGSLQDELSRSGRMDPARAVRIIDGVLAGLQEIHAAGIVHRDLKPGNILLDREGHPKVSDFGVAKPPASLAAAATLAVEGSQPGSLAYMSPEQAQGGAVDERSDLFAVGAMLYLMVAGEPHLHLEGATEVEIRREVQEWDGKLRQGKLPESLRKFLEKSLSPAPGHRFASAQAMRAALGTISGSDVGSLIRAGEQLGRRGPGPSPRMFPGKSRSNSAPITSRS